MNMLRKTITVDPTRQALANAAIAQPGSKGLGPGAPIPKAPTPVRPGHPAADMARTAGGASPATTPPRTEPSKTTKTSKPRVKTETSAPHSGSAKTAARRQAHTGHAIVAPWGRESGGKGSGGFHGQGHMAIQDWVPFSAQQSRILRTPRENPAVGSSKGMSHGPHSIRHAAISLARHIYSEVLPSLFRQTARQADRNDRQTRNEILRKDVKQRSIRNEARREAIRKRAETNPQPVMAGDLTTTFATR